MLLMGCAAPQSTLMRSEGKVILIRGCEVCVSYDVVNMDWSDKSLGCFAHLNGHRYQVGDTYPDADKHSTGKPVDCEQTNWEPHPIDSLLSDAEDGWKRDARKRMRRQKRIQRRNGIGWTASPQTGELA